MIKYDMKFLISQLSRLFLVFCLFICLFLMVWFKFLIDFVIKFAWFVFMSCLFCFSPFVCFCFAKHMFGKVTVAQTPTDLFRFFFFFFFKSSRISF